MQAEISDRGAFTTQNASRYLQQLCKHFAHKIEVQFDETHGTAQFPFGPAVMTATADALTVELSAESEDGLAKGRGVIDSHLKTFAFREGFERMDWASSRA